MDDNKIIELYFARDERAIEETKLKYGRLLLSIAGSILGDRLESEACESDTYVRAWDSIPPTRPVYFAAFLSKITRNIALNRLRDNMRHNPPEFNLIIAELGEFAGQGDDVVDSIDLRDALNGFVSSLDPTRRNIFIQRYFYMLSLREIALEQGMSVGTVKSTLFRIRRMLCEYLCERGVEI